VRLSDVEIVTDGDRAELRARVESAALTEPFLLHYRVPAELAAGLSATNGDPFLAALLLPAMRIGEPLELDLPSSSRLLQSMEQIQAIYRAWSPDLSVVGIRAPVRSEPIPESPTRGVGLFFSLGVDSFHTLVADAKRHRERNGTITHLIMLKGFDRRPVDQNVWGSVVANLERVSEEFGKRPVVLESNIRRLTDRFVSWPDLAHGAALASVGLALQGPLREVQIASSNPYNRLEPWGSHPLLDPLWSTESLSVVHTGAETRRIDKTRTVVAFPIVRDTLRVCNSIGGPSARSSYNCGRCYKCVRTTIDLHIVGALSACATLPPAVDLDLVRKLPVRRSSRAESMRMRLDALGRSPEDLAIKSALQDRLERATAAWEGRRQAGDDGPTEVELRQQIDAIRTENAALRSRARELRRRTIAARTKLGAARKSNRQPEPTTEPTVRSPWRRVGARLRALIRSMAP
jgi:hypothetical protein